MVKINNTLHFKQDEIMGLLIVFIALWLVLYLLPQAFASLFHTLLGNCILLLGTLLLYSYHRGYGIVAAVSVVLLYRTIQLQEPFTPQSERQFLEIQNTINKQTVFDMNVIETQASQEELDYFNQHGRWPWSPEVIELYEEAVKKNPYVRTQVQAATMDAQTIYNQAAILRILTYQSREGQFLLKGLPASGDICNLSTNQLADGVKPDDLPTLLPGFTFLQSPCNPCGSMAAIPDYSCHYQLQKDQPPSSVWQYLWS